MGDETDDKDLEQGQDTEGADPLGNAVPEQLVTDDPEEEEAAFMAAFEGEEIPESDGDAETPEGEDTPGDEVPGGDDAPEPGEDAESDSDEGDDAGGDQPTMAQMQQQISDAMTRLRRAEGHLGNLQNENRQLKENVAAASAATAQAGGEVPSSEQITEALSSEETFAKFKEEFPEWGDAMLALQTVTYDHLLQQLQAQQGGQGGDAQPQNYTHEQLVELARVTAEETTVTNHFEDRDWEGDLRTDLYAAWSEGQPDDLRALETSNRASDVIKLLDQFYDFKTYVEELGDDAKRFTPVALLESYQQGGVESAATAQENKRKAAQDRLRGAVPATKPTGGGGGTKRKSAAQLEQEAFEAGFNSQ